MPPRGKRPPPGAAKGSVKQESPSAKRVKRSGAAGGSSIAIGTTRGGVAAGQVVRIKHDPEGGGQLMNRRGGGGGGGGGGGDGDEKTDEELKQELVSVLTNPAHLKRTGGGNSKGVANSVLKEHFSTAHYLRLAPLLNDLTRQSKLTMSRVVADDGMSTELYYTLVSDEMASKFKGLDASARLIYQTIEKAGNTGIWTKDIRVRTGVQQVTLNKALKEMETRQLIKQIKSVTAKSKKMYMLYDLTPSREVTGGPWYSELEFDFEFIAQLRDFVGLCVKRMHQGKGVTLGEIAEQLRKAQISKVTLNQDEVRQLLQTLAFDYQLEQAGVNPQGEPLFIAARPVTTMCEFNWWEVLTPDFHFRTIKFEDGVTLGPHEPHHHTA